MDWIELPITFKIGICAESDEGSFHAYCPALKGLHVSGETKEEAIENAKIAIELYLKSLIKHREPIPNSGCADEGCDDCGKGEDCKIRKEGMTFKNDR